MKYWLILCCIFFHAIAFAANYPVKMGDTLIIVKVEKKGPGKMFVHLHQNETTALHAARAMVAAKGGSILTLVHPGGRNIIFRLQGQRYEFDPNRIYSDAGIKKTLRQFGPYTPAAHRTVQKLATKIKQLLPKSGKIIAVHNNQCYSLKDYLPGHSLSAEAKKLHFHDKHQYRNFYLVTRDHDFLRLRDLKFNSVLQARQATDDGSLSVYLANRQYVNVEAGFDQLKAQIKMLQYA